MAPYLARIGNPKQISKAQAYLLREDCLNDFKQSEVEKANLILRESEKLTEKLNELQLLLTQVQTHRLYYISQSYIMFLYKIVTFHI